MFSNIISSDRIYYSRTSEIKFKMSFILPINTPSKYLYVIRFCSCVVYLQFNTPVQLLLSFIFSMVYSDFALSEHSLDQPLENRNEVNSRLDKIYVRWNQTKHNHCKWYWHRWCCSLGRRANMIVSKQVCVGYEYALYVVQYG